jgi:SagB-type dehydrogenase family enzyme
MNRWKVAAWCLFALVTGYLLLASTAPERQRKSTGAGFHEGTKHTVGEVLGSLMRWESQPDREKRYEGVPVVPLPERARGAKSIEDAIDMRRSVRNFSGGTTVSLSVLSSLLHSSSGLTGEFESELPLRAAPSAGALYPIETYVVVYRVEGLEPGIYHYVPTGHVLERIRSGDFRNEFIAAALHQDMAGRCNFLYVLTAIFRRTTWKYGDRGYRYAYIEAGAISENIYLQVTTLGLGSVVIGAFFDDRVSELIGIDGEKEAPILLHAVGTL